MKVAKPTPRYIQTVYLSLTLLNTLAASFIWGINTLFLLNAGLDNTQAFLANAFFTIGQVIFEVPTGMIADIKGRRVSYLLGTVTLALATLLYLGAWQIHASLWLWAVASILLGLGFTFFSGATEAWVVDALAFAGHKGELESVFAKSQIVAGAAMLTGSVAGGVIAQATNLSVPYILRALLLVMTFGVAFVFMKDWGFTPTKSANLGKDFRQLFVTSFNLGMRNPGVRWVMLAAPLISGVSFYAFYAMQPYLLKLYGDETAYAVAGLAAAIVAGAQIVGGFAVPHVKRFFRLRTSVMLVATGVGAVLLGLIGLTTNFWAAILLLSLWGLISALVQPVRQAYLNGLIPSQQRATVLSFDSLMASSGGVVIQPLLGKIADLVGYSSSFVAGAGFQGLSLPFIWLARRVRTPADALK